MERPNGLDSPLVPKLLKVMSRVNVWFYRRTNGRVGGKWRIGAGFRKPVPTLLLDHDGRKSGRRFTVPLLYLGDGDDVVVVASQGGMSTHPQWYRNLLADPNVTVQVKDDRYAAVARTASPEEKQRLWPLVAEVWPSYDDYQAATDRQIPLIVLDPVE